MKIKRFFASALIFIAAFIIIILLLVPRVARSDNQAQLPAVSGYLDKISINNNNFKAQGWACVSQKNSKITSLTLSLGNSLIYEGGFRSFERPDVVKALGREDCLESGWLINANLPSNLKPGEYIVEVSATTDSGYKNQLTVTDYYKRISIDEDFYQANRASWIVKIYIIFSFLFIVLAYLRAEQFSRLLFGKSNKIIKPPVFFALILFLSFLGGVSLGITGSSLNLGPPSAPFIKSDAINVWGKGKPIRSDEWLVFTPLAIAQYNHSPKFPIVNTNLGEDGQNMLVVGMAGAPVAHISGLAKPATWGFFLFDLKRALSWYWFFPIFASLFALWGVVNIILSGRWRSSFLISLLFCLSPYVNAWSNWPAYTVFFPSLALLSSVAILRATNGYALFALGGVLGLSLAGFALVLYPPWQISLCYVFMALAVGIFARDKLYKNINIVKLVSFGFAIIVAVTLILAWWLDAQLAIQAMMATVYPGQRESLTGGGYTLPQLLRGFTNLITLHGLDSPYSNQSEIASFFYMLLPLLSLFIIRLYQRAIGALEVMLSVSIILILLFMFFGVSIDVANYSFWGRVPPIRADVALGLSTIILSGLLLSSGRGNISNEILVKILAFFVTIMWAAVVFHSILRLDASIISGFTPIVYSGLFLVITVSGYWMVMGNFRNFIFTSLALSIAAIWQFNPINIAPLNISINSFISDFNERELDNFVGQRALVLESVVPSMYLLASGYPVVNGVFYYPQKSLWNRLDSDHKEASKHNRYQHLVFVGGDVANSLNYRIESPSPDQVRVVVSLERFDFGITGASIVIAPQHHESALAKNVGLIHVKTEKGWTLFKIKGGFENAKDPAT